MNTKNPRDVVIQPVVSEKSYDLIQDSNTYTFLVDKRSNKTEIRQAVEAIFGVSVVGVNTINRKGKRKRTGWKFGTRPSTKRALVKLAEGSSIDIFEV